MADTTASVDVLNKLLAPLNVSVAEGEVVEVTFADGANVKVQATN